MKTSLRIFIFILLPLATSAQNPAKWAKNIDITDLRTHLSILTADSLQGRETGSKGQKRAAAYLAKQFRSFGLSPVVTSTTDTSYFQEFQLEKSEWHRISIQVHDSSFDNLEEIVYFSQKETLGMELRQALYVKNLEQAKQLNIAGKIIVFENGADSNAIIDFGKENDVDGYIIIMSAPATFIRFRRQFQNFFRPSLGFKTDDEGEKIFMVSPDFAEFLFQDSLSNLKPGLQQEIIINADKIIKKVKTENVLGFLPGTKRPEEVLVISCHYDHLGIINGKIHPGADDNGSGTAAVLEIAQAFAMAKAKGQGPLRSILFLAVSGEEKGLLGSKFYCDQSPVIPLENTIANLNIDMVGRIDQRHKNDPDYLYLIGSDRISMDLHKLSERVNNASVQLNLDYTYNSPEDPNRFYYRSDHYNFAKNNIPVIFYFNGTHEDYHQATDTIEKIEFDLLQKRTELIFYTAWEILNREERLRSD